MYELIQTPGLYSGSDNCTASVGFNVASPCISLENMVCVQVVTQSDGKHYEHSGKGSVFVCDIVLPCI